MNTEHVTATIEAFCKHCQGEDSVISIPASCATDVLRAFLLRHRRCEKPVEPSKQVELFDKLRAKEEGYLYECDGCHQRVMVREVTREGASACLCEKCAGIDASTDEPAPEIDPPGRHGNGPILDAVELRHLITCVRPKELWPSLETVETWHQDVRSDVQRWCQTEHAHARPIAGISLPERFPMPDVLQHYPPPKKKRAGARPFTSPSAELPAVAPAKKTRKRMSGSTQHSD